MQTKAELRKEIRWLKAELKRAIAEGDKQEADSIDEVLRCLKYELEIYDSNNC